MKRYAPGNSFVDIGCMWGVNGGFAFLAEEVGAVSVKGVDVFGPTPEFEETRRKRGSAVEFVLGDCTHPETIARIGAADVVFCAGVLYHHPAPFDLLVALRQICRKTLILRAATIPEMTGLPNAAVFYPMLTAEHRKLWNLSSLGLGKQVGITAAFEAQRYGNWFWGLTPSCLRSVVETAGFRSISSRRRRSRRPDLHTRHERVPPRTPTPLKRSNLPRCRELASRSRREVSARRAVKRVRLRVQ